MKKSTMGAPGYSIKNLRTDLFVFTLITLCIGIVLAMFVRNYTSHLLNSLFWAISTIF